MKKRLFMQNTRKRLFYASYIINEYIYRKASRNARREIGKITKEYDVIFIVLIDGLSVHE